jgi:hypothetical protein
VQVSEAIILFQKSFEKLIDHDGGLWCEYQPDDEYEYGRYSGGNTRTFAGIDGRNAR